MGIILSALAAASDAGVKSIDEDLKASRESELLKQKLAGESTLQTQRSDLELAKQKALLDYQESIKNAPLNRAGVVVREEAGKEVPVTAAPVKTLSGDDPNSDFNKAGSENADGKGLSGDIKALRDQLTNAPPYDATTGKGITEEDRRAALAQIDRQAATDQATAQAPLEGQTRKPTSDEAFDTALARLKVDDPVAYGELKKLATEKYTKVGKDDVLLDRTGKPVYANTAGADRAEEREDRRDERQQRSIDAAEARQQRTLQAALDRNAASHTLTPEMATTAKAIAEGKLPPITGYGLKTPGGALIMAEVLSLNPDYSGKDYGTSAKSEKDFATGKQGNTIRSFNVAISHLDTLDKLSDALNNGDMQVVNKIGNIVATQTGKPAPVNFEAAKRIVADEVVKAIVGSGGALADREDAAKTISAASSPAQLKGVINTYKELMNGQLSGLRDQYKATTGKDDFDRFLSAGAKSASKSDEKPAAGGIKFLGFE